MPACNHVCVCMFHVCICPCIVCLCICACCIDPWGGPDSGSTSSPASGRLGRGRGTARAAADRGRLTTRLGDAAQNQAAWLAARSSARDRAAIFGHLERFEPFRPGCRPTAEDVRSTLASVTQCACILIWVGWLVWRSYGPDREAERTRYEFGARSGQGAGGPCGAMGRDRWDVILLRRPCERLLTCRLANVPCADSSRARGRSMGASVDDDRHSREPLRLQRLEANGPYGWGRWLAGPT
jgi:hypothetical protein